MKESQFKKYESITPQQLINIEPVIGLLKEFLGKLSIITNSWTKANPLAELTHKRRLSGIRTWWFNT